MISINNKPVKIDKFPDGALLLKEYPYSISSIAVTLYDNVKISWHFENNEELVALIYLTNHLRSHGIKNIELYMPYIPNARQDRVKTPEDVFTLKYFAKVINSLEFDKVTVLDPHSPVSEALVENISILSLEKYIDAVIDEIMRGGKYADEHGITNLVMFYPDEGAMKRYSGLVNRPYAFGIKDRDWSSGEIKGLKVEGAVDTLKDSTVLIVDDICSRGGTFYYSAIKLKEFGVKNIILYITHCENTILEGELLKSDLINHIYTTDSIYRTEHEKISVLKMVYD